eukprot:1165253-Amphidinium_carterae.1
MPIQPRSLYSPRTVGNPHPVGKAILTCKGQVRQDIALHSLRAIPEKSGNIPTASNKVSKTAPL